GTPTPVVRVFGMIVFTGWAGGPGPLGAGNPGGGAGHVVHRSQRPGGEQVAGAVGGIQPRTVDTAARDRHDGNCVVGEGGTVAVESCQVVPVERRVLQPLDRAGEKQLLGNGRTIRSHDVDLDVVGAGPVAAHCGGRGQPVV